MALMYQRKAVSLFLVVGVNTVSDGLLVLTLKHSGIKCKFLISLEAEPGNGPGESVLSLRISAYD